MIASANVRRVVYRDDREAVLECGHVTLSAVGGEFTRCAECACEQPEAPEYSSVEVKALDDCKRWTPRDGSVLRDPESGRLIVFLIAGKQVRALNRSGGFTLVGTRWPDGWDWHNVAPEGLADLARQAWERAS